MSSILQLTASSSLANNENKGLPLKETETPTLGSFCIWVHPGKAQSSFWQEEGAICIKPDYFYAPGITKCEGENTKLTPTSEIESVMHTTKKRCFNVDLDALDKLSGCSSHKAAKLFNERVKTNPTK